MGKVFFYIDVFEDIRLLRKCPTPQQIFSFLSNTYLWDLTLEDLLSEEKPTWFLFLPA